MTCDTAKILLLFSRPNGGSDLAPTDAAELAQHLNVCPDCAALSRQAREQDQAIALAMQSVPVPDDLAKRIVAAGYAEQGRLLRRKIFATLGAIAFIISGGVAGYALHWYTRPDLDSPQLLDQLQSEIENPEATTRNWLLAQRLPQHLPEPFDFRLLTSRGLADLQGEMIPCLTFQVWRPGEVRPDTAKVFILSREQFKLHTLQQCQNSFGTVRIVPDDGRGWAYVIAHTANLELFLKPNFRQVT